MNEMMQPMPQQIVDLPQPAAQNAALYASGVGTAMMIAREAKEVEVSILSAKRFPRDENQSLARIRQSCQRRGLAEKAVYSYPKGGGKVMGPSIRLAEAIAQAWGNLDFDVVEVERRENESVWKAYCWDKETNTRTSRVFTVPHAIQTKTGTKVLTDPRDIYELGANQAARRLRACILAIIPGYVVDVAVGECQHTLSSGNTVPLIDRLRNMADVFHKEFSVPLECLEKYMGYALDSFTELDMVTLRGIYTALKEGTSKREDYFTLPKPKTSKKPVESPQETEAGQVKLSDL
jgi:hypothetical protein